MPLYGEKHVTVPLDETCLHAVSPERVLQLRSKAVVATQCIDSCRHVLFSYGLGVTAFHPDLECLTHEGKELSGGKLVPLLIMSLAKRLEFVLEFPVGVHHDEVKIHNKTLLTQLHQLVVGAEW